MDKAYDKFDWRQAKGKLRVRWDRLTDADFDQIGTDRSQLAERIQKNYGVSASDAEQQIVEWENAQGQWDPSSAEGPAPMPPTAVIDGDNSSEPGVSGMSGRTWQRPPEYERASDANTEVKEPRDLQLERIQSSSGNKVHGDKLGPLTGTREEVTKAHEEAAAGSRARKK